MKLTFTFDLSLNETQEKVCLKIGGNLKTTSL